MFVTAISEMGKTITYENWHIDRCKFAFCRMYFVISGECRYTDDDTSSMLEKSHLYLLPTNKPYSLYENPENKLNHFYIHMMLSSPINQFTEIPLIPNSFANDIFALVCKYIVKNDTEKVASLTNLLISDFFEKYDADNICIRIKKYINDNLLSKITVKNLSKKFGYSEVHLSRLFKKQFSVSLFQYIHDCKLEYSLEKLRNGDNIATVSDLLGFSSESNFSKAFKKKYGMPPRTYILSQKLLKNVSSNFADET